MHKYWSSSFIWNPFLYCVCLSASQFMKIVTTDLQCFHTIHCTKQTSPLKTQEITLTVLPTVGFLMKTFKSTEGLTWLLRHGYCLFFLFPWNPPGGYDAWGGSGGEDVCLVHPSPYGEDPPYWLCSKGRCNSAFYQDRSILVTILVNILFRKQYRKNQLTLSKGWWSLKKGMISK